jgi:hypothetical protein
MEDALRRRFLDHSIEKLHQYTSRIDTCLHMLTDDQIWARGHENENAAGNLVLHLSGNVRQWIVSGVGGQPDVRRRDEEFAARGGITIDELMAKLKGTVEEASAVIGAVTPEGFARNLIVQGYPVTGMEAIYHVVEHFSMHTGQIIFATKLLTGSDLGFYGHLSGQGKARKQEVL